MLLAKVLFSLKGIHILSLLANLGACGASGVAVGFVISVIQDSIETALNSSGDVMFAATAEFHDKMKRGEEIEFFKKK